MKLPSKSVIELTYDPANPILSIYLKEIKILNCKDICTCMLIATLFMIGKTWGKKKSVFINEKKMGEKNVLNTYYIYIYLSNTFHTNTHKYHLDIKKKEILPFITTCVEFESITPSEISQKEKDRNCMISLICGI